MPGIQPALPEPRRAEGSPALGVRALWLAQPLPVGYQTDQVPCICWGRSAETLHPASGLATPFNHLFQIQDQLTSDPQMELLVSFSSISLLLGLFREA